jgi:hypothetical protein
MASVLDTIADHLQKDPSSRHLFFDDDEKSETPTIIENRTMTTMDTNTDDVQNPHEDNNIVPMQIIRDSGGIKRLHGTDRSPSRSQRISKPNTSSPQITPPPKRERATNSAPSAHPDGAARERGENKMSTKAPQLKPRRKTSN